MRRFVASLAVALTALVGVNLFPLKAQAAATTPTLTGCATDGYCYAGFTTVIAGGTWSIPANTYTIDVLAVGGGGGGTRGKCSYVWGQGGGGGGFAEVMTQSVIAGATATISVGGGGTGAGECSTATQGTQGGTTSIAVNSVAIYAYGGYAPGSGTAYSTNVGGNSGNNSINSVIGAGTAGGAPAYDSTGNCSGASACAAGGGGGAGAAGSGMNAGTGRVSTLTGVRYAGGGGGRNSTTYGTADTNSGYSGRCDAVANFGGGGADCNAQGAGRGGNGGSGYLYLRYLPGPTVTAPAATAVTVGQTATFSTAATKSGNLTTANITYQWQQSTDSGSTWTNIAGATSASYTTPTQANTAANGYQYRAKVTQTGATGSVLPTGYTYTSSATLTVKQSNVITFGSIANATYGDSAITVAPTASSGLTVALTSATTGVCTVASFTITLVAAGTCTINANQSGDATYLAATQVQQSFTVAQKALTITASNDTKIYGGTKTYGSGSTAFSSSGLVGSQTIGSVTITASGGTAAADNVGSYTLTPSSALGGTFVASNYAITYVTGTLTVSQASPTFTWANASTTYSTNGTYTLTAPTVTVGGTGTWVYSSSDTTVASVSSGAVLNLLKAGTTTITGTFTPTSGNYSSGTKTMVLTVAAGTNTITWSQTLGSVAYGSANIALTATASSGQAITYSTNNSAICSVSGSTLTIVGVGSCTVSANQAGDTGYSAATAVAKTFTVTQAGNTITFGALAGKTYGDAAFAISASASSGLSVTFTSATTGVCTVSGSTVTIVAAGTCTINSNQAGNTSYSAATQVAQSFTVSTKTLTITATNDTKVFGATKTYGAGSTAFTQSGLVGAETIGSVTITASGGASSAANIGGYTLTPSAATGGTFVASNYTISYVAGNLTVSAANPVFSWLNATTTYAPSGTYTLTAPTVTTGGTGTWSYSSSDSTVATISSGAVLNILAAGTTTITATFTPSSSNFTSGTTTTMTLTVALATNTITWSQTLGNVAFGVSPISLTATASSGFTIAYSTNNSSICSVSGSTLTIVAVGSCTVTANQAGDANYSSATPSAKTFTVGQAANVIVFASAPTGLTYGETGQSRQVSASVTSGTIAYSTSSAACSVDPTTGAVTILTAGSCVITATASAVSGNYATPTAQSQTLTIATASTSAGAWSNANTTYAPGATYAIAAPAVSSGAVQGSVSGTWSFSSSDTTVATITASTINLLKPGTVTITGTFTPSNSSLASTTATFTLTIGLGNNVITFGALANKTVTSGTFSASASASSGLTTVITSGTTSVCTISAGTVTLVGIGTCTLNANQAGNTYYAAATQVAQSFVVSAIVVTFDSNFGISTTRTQSITAPAGANLLANNFARTGYTFTGWSGSAGGTVTHADGQSVAFIADTNLFAVWSANNYGITYFPNGANSGAVPSDTANYNIGQAITVRSNSGSLAKTGYSFGGWNTAANGSGFTYNSGESVTMGAQSVSLFAIWTPNTYTVTYNNNGASGSASRSGSSITSDSYTTAGPAVSLPSVGTLAKTGYTFNGWATAPTGTPISGSYTTTTNVTLYAQWSIMVINVTYAKGAAAASNFVQFPSATTGNYGTRVTLSSAVDSPVTISGNAHVFVGWSDGNSIYRAGDTYLLGVNAVTLTAQWVQIFGVRYSFAGGTAAAGDTVVDTECLLAGNLCTDQQSITAHAAPTRAGYTFTGWVDQSGNAIAAASAFTVSTGTYLLYATWLANNYNISYSGNGSAAATPTQNALHYGDTFNVGSAIARTGYDFAGWNDGLQTYGAGAAYSVGLADISFTAVWTPHVYTVVYDWNGGSGSAIANRSYTVGTAAFTLPTATNQVRDGYNFAGWSLTPNGTAIASPFTPTQNQSLYAVWTTGAFALNFDAGLGTLAQANVSVANGSSVVLPTPTRSHFVFTGWYSAATGGTLVGIAGATHQPTGSGTVYAHWVQSSLYGIAPGNLTRIGTINALSLVGSSYSGSTDTSSVQVSVPAGALPNGTAVAIDLIADNSYAQSLISGANTYVLSVAVSWLASDGTVPNTAAGKAVSLTVTNPSIRAGALVYSIQDGVATLLGTATASGTVTVELTSDPGIYVVQTIASAPRTLTGVAAQNSVVFSWLAPLTDGGSTITAYTVTLNDGSTCTTTTLTCTISNLTHGTPYSAQLTATNGVGTSVAATASVLTLSPVVAPPVVIPVKKAPGAPLALTVGYSGTTLLLRWGAPTLDGGSAITGYAVSSNAGIGCQTTENSCEIANALAGFRYVFEVVAINEFGTGASSNSASVVIPEVLQTKPVIVPVQSVTAVISVNKVTGAPKLAGAPVVAPIRFAANSATLDSADLKQIAAAASQLRGAKGFVLITGFVKFTGKPKATELAIAKDRALVVAKALSKFGVTVKLGYTGFGAANRLNPSNADRKVEIRFVAQK